jgi:hypothetical protein
MIKILVLINRNPRLSVQEFRDYYENNHANFMNELKSVVKDYRRNYANVEGTKLVNTFHQPTFAASGLDVPFCDVVTELWLEDLNALRELYRILGETQVGAQIKDDEDSFLDKASLRVMVCDEVITDLRR